MLASDYCPNVTTAYVLDLSQPNVSSGWGYKRELLTTPLSAALQATYQAQLEEGLISSIPAGEPVRTNSGTVQLYSDLMYSGMCTTHTTPLEPTPDPDAPDVPQLAAQQRRHRPVKSNKKENGENRSLFYAAASAFAFRICANSSRRKGKSTIPATPNVQ